MVAEQNFEIEFAKIYPNFTKKLVQLNSNLTLKEALLILKETRPQGKC